MSVNFRLYSAILSHAPVDTVTEILEELAGWRGEDLQALLVSEYLDHTRTFPLSTKYTKAVIRVLERACVQAMDDSMAEYIVEFHSKVRAREVEAEVEDRAYSSYMIPDSKGDADTFSIVPLRCIRDHNLVGLKAWEAGLALTEVLIEHGGLLLAGKAVHELGAGVGNTGILVAKSINMKTLIMTDFNEEILENLQFNLDLNMKRGLTTQAVKVDFCDWRAIEDPEAEGDAARYGKSDVILAADCTYSKDICTSLVGTIEALLEHSCEERVVVARELPSNPVEAQKRYGQIAIVAAVERNEETYAHFLTILKSRRPRLEHFDCTAWALAACEARPLFCYGFRDKLRFVCIHLAL